MSKRHWWTKPRWRETTVYRTYLLDKELNVVRIEVEANGDWRVGYKDDEQWTHFGTCSSSEAARRFAVKAARKLIKERTP